MSAAEHFVVRPPISGKAGSPSPSKESSTMRGYSKAVLAFGLVAALSGTAMAQRPGGGFGGFGGFGASGEGGWSLGPGC